MVCAWTAKMRCACVRVALASSLPVCPCPLIIGSSARSHDRRPIAPTCCASNARPTSRGRMPSGGGERMRRSGPTERRRCRGRGNRHRGRAPARDQASALISAAPCAPWVRICRNDSAPVAQPAVSVRTRDGRAERVAGSAGSALAPRFRKVAVPPVRPCCRHGRLHARRGGSAGRRRLQRGRPVRQPPAVAAQGRVATSSGQRFGGSVVAG
jgi:hypothetical protein